MGGGSGGGGRERISTSAAKTQLTARQKSLSRSLVGRLPTMASLMGNISLASQQKALDQLGWQSWGVRDFFSNLTNRQVLDASTTYAAFTAYAGCHLAVWKNFV